MLDFVSATSIKFDSINRKISMTVKLLQKGCVSYVPQNSKKLLEDEKKKEAEKMNSHKRVKRTKHACDFCSTVLSYHLYKDHSSSFHEIWGVCFIDIIDRWVIRRNTIYICLIFLTSTLTSDSSFSVIIYSLKNNGIWIVDIRLIFFVDLYVLNIASMVKSQCHSK